VMSLSGAWPLPRMLPTQTNNPKPARSALRCAGPYRPNFRPETEVVIAQQILWQDGNKQGTQSGAPREIACGLDSMVKPTHMRPVTPAKGSAGSPSVCRSQYFVAIPSRAPQSPLLSVTSHPSFDP